MRGRPLAGLLAVTVLLALSAAGAGAVPGAGEPSPAPICPADRDAGPFTSGADLVAGRQALLASATAPLPAVGAGALQVVTVPALAGAVFTLDGRPAVTGADGIATFPTRGVGDLADRLRLESVPAAPHVRADFVRFSTLADSASTGRAFAMFDISTDVRVSFRDLRSVVVPASRVSTLKVKSSRGDELTLGPADLDCPVMLPTLRVVSGPERPRIAEVRYSVLETVIDGTNTVNRSQQTFFPSRQRDLSVETQFFEVAVTVRDRLFGFANGAAVLVRSPDGAVARVPVSDGKVTLPALPRGQYEMRVDGPGLKVWRPVSISRDQTVDLALFSAVDLAAGVVAVTLLAAAAVVVRHRRVVRA